MTNLSAATASNPSYLPARYEIRRLEEKHIPWSVALVFHSNMFCSPVWPVVYPEAKTARLMRGYAAGDYLIRHQIMSGHSFGVFDLEYRFKRPESEVEGGKLYWNPDDLDATEEELLDQMDFPLVGVALAYDGINPLNFAKMGPLIGVLPLFGDIYGHLGSRDSRDPASWQPTEPHQVLLRNATATRSDAMGLGLMRKLAEFLMRYAAEQGFRAIQIECLQDAVTKVWLSPPPPFKATLICEFNTQDIVEEREVDGKPVQVKPFRDAKQRATKIFVDLKPSDIGNVSGGVSLPGVGALG